MDIQPKLSLYLALILAVIVGTAYNALVARANETGRTEGYTALLVVGGGVVITFIFIGFFVSLETLTLIVYFFMATGTPMILGDIIRYIRRRDKGRKLLK